MHPSCSHVLGWWRGAPYQHHDVATSWVDLPYGDRVKPLFVRHRSRLEPLVRAGWRRCPTILVFSQLSRPFQTLLATPPAFRWLPTRRLVAVSGCRQSSGATLTCYRTRLPPCGPQPGVLDPVRNAPVLMFSRDYRYSPVTTRHIVRASDNVPVSPKPVTRSLARGHLLP